MAKPKLNIVSAFTWLSNIIDTQELSSSEQLVLLHLVKFLNRNFWRAVKISDYKLAKIMGKKDSRTVTTALKNLKKKGIVIEQKGELHIGIDGAENHFTKTDEPEEQPKPSETSPQPEKQPDDRTKIKNLADYM